MKIEDIKAGQVLVLTRDVKNPKPDRRTADRHWDKQPVWEAGRLFWVNTFDYTQLSSGYGRLSPSTPGFDALVDACEVAPRTLATILYGLTCGRTLVGYQEEILEVLVQDGMVTLEQIDAAIRTIREREAA